MANEILVQSSMDTRTIYCIKKSVEIAFKNGRIIKGKYSKIQTLQKKNEKIRHK